MKAWRVIAFLAVALVAVACSSPGPVARAPGYSVSLSRIVAAANTQNSNQGSRAIFHLAPAGTKAPLTRAEAARVVITGCNEGRGTRVLVAGLVTGSMEAGSRLYWAVFVDPPGKHVAAYSQPVAHPMVLNWIGAFVPVRNTAEPFCTFGHAAGLPALPVFGS